MDFTPVFVEARDLQEAYFLLIKNCWEHGYKYKITEGSNAGGYRLELPLATGFIHNPHLRPLSPIMPYGVPQTTTDEKIKDYFVNYLMNPELEENEEYRYSTWINGEFYNLYKKRKESLLNWCINHFKEKGFGNNHCFINIGEPWINFNYDFKYINETQRRTSPCLRGIDIKIKDNKVILGIIYRSWDLYAGFPENMGGFTLLNEYIAENLGIEKGPITFYSQGLHCYDYQISSVVNYLNIGNKNK